MNPNPNPNPNPNSHGRALRVHVHLGRGLDADRYGRRFEQGLEVDASPYGLDEARALGCQLSYSQDAAESPLMRWPRRGLKWLLGFDLIHAWRNRALWQAADVIWTVQESEWLALVALGRLGLARPPLIANSVWLFERWPRLGPWRRQLVRHLARHAEQLTVHSVPAQAVAQRVLPGVNVRWLPFGVAQRQFEVPTSVVPPPAPHLRHTPIRLFAPGSDDTRDWDTLLKAVGGDPRFKLRILSGQPRVRAAAQGLANVRVEHWRGLKHLLSAYDACDLVVIPMRPNNYAGITVCLEASWRGRPVVSAQTGGVASYLGPEGATWYTPGDAEALKAALLLALTRSEAQLGQARRQLAEGRFTTEGMAGRYLLLSRQLLRSAPDASPPLHCTGPRHC